MRPHQHYFAGAKRKLRRALALGRSLAGLKPGHYRWKAREKPQAQKTGLSYTFRRLRSRNGSEERFEGFDYGGDGGV